jgi:hypothetical protein
MADTNDLEARVAFLEELIHNLLGVRVGKDVSRDRLRSLSLRLSDRPWRLDEELLLSLSQFTHSQQETTQRLSEVVSGAARELGAGLARIADFAERGARSEDRIGAVDGGCAGHSEEALAEN